MKIARLLPSRADFAARHLRHDLLAGLAVAVVALPLALGFGVTSGAGAAAAIVAGFVAAVFGGSDFQVSGPTGAMTVVLLPIVARYGVTALAAGGVVAGVILVALSLAGVGRYAHYIPWPVIERTGVLDEISRSRDHLFETTEEAIVHARLHLSSADHLVPAAGGAGT